ncbi:MAG: 50S ribosomal protein L10 [Bacteroidales bacterium]|jgi:large subunit ribosomal protein L10|nr:50S ribosomal protein L10 [Bacteroidales bacterium]
MKKEQKSQIIDEIAAQLKENSNFYLVNVEGLNAEQTSELRRTCFTKDIKMIVVKNTLFFKALEKAGIEGYEDLKDYLKGSTAIMYTEVPNAPARMIKDFSAKYSKPELKAAYVQESFYLGAENLESLCTIKSREELLGDIVALLQSPIKNVVSALQSQSSQKIAGIVKTLSEKEK